MAKAHYPYDGCTMNTCFIKVKQLRKSFGKLTVLDNLHGAVAKETIFSLPGPFNSYFSTFITCH
jgi:ABC-type polar amino acid transport system ATPase subunit